MSMDMATKASFYFNRSIRQYDEIKTLKEQIEALEIKLAQSQAMNHLFGTDGMTICGMNCDQVNELKSFWMKHHEELPK